ncbi:MAG: DUF5123 domain-containing protein, partial [Lentisphaerae bacterium]|nr:DUF5123 domain-containing protein [Lentisphaerota bacterium]
MADYAGLDASDTGWVFQLAGLATTRYVDDDYCSACSNDGHTWGVDAFDAVQPAIDAAWFADTIMIAAGVYSNATVHAGQDYLSLHGSDADAVFIDGNGGAAITLLPADEVSTTYPNIEGVSISNLTIRNAATAIVVNYGGRTSARPVSGDDRNIQISNVLFYQDIADSTAINALSSALQVSHNTFVSNASGVTLLHSRPGALTENDIFLQDNLFVALPNAAPLPYWWLDDSSQNPGRELSNGFASENAAASDWQSTPSGALMTIEDAKFLNVAKEIFRIGANSAAVGQASGGSDQGYYNYKAPVYVEATCCAKCDNDGHTWGADAFTSIQEGIARGAQKVLVDPGLYRERISLVNGVSVFGSGAGLTVLAPPDSNGGHLAGFENAKEATLALITIAGEDTADGIKVSAEGEATLERLIIRNTGAAISVTDSSALATVVNSTIVSNDAGVSATQCSSIDIRNSILAFHQNAALSYDSSSCDSTQTTLHTYNAYWRNGSDLAIDGSAIDSPGPGEIFVDPRFTDVNNHDYRPLADSPVVDAGDPSDPAPPGSGERVDMGYAQSAEAAVYASKDYCEQCLNDGLEWQVTAFDSIQDAVDNVPAIEVVWSVVVFGGDSATMLYTEN